MSGLLPCVRARVAAAAAASHYRVSILPTTIRTFTYSSQLSRQGPGAGENFQQANDPTPRKVTPNVSKTNETAVDIGAFDGDLIESVEDAERQRQLQAPNRKTTWSKSQMPRELAMSGPRFEQTIMEVQPQPYAAIDLIHKQPVRWTDKRQVACDGGGGPLGHPKIFINLDKQQICHCTYCGLPYANTHNRKYIEAQPRHSYPLEPTGDPAVVAMPRTLSQHGEVQGEYPQLKGELDAQSVDGAPYSQR